MINATWLTLTDDYFKCEQTEESLRKRKDAEVAIQYVRKEKGCGVIRPEPRVEIEGINYHSCLCHKNFKDHTIHNSIWLHKQFQNGILGFEGPLTEQPAKYIDLMRFLDRLQSEYEQKQIQEQQNKGNK